jgi:hypothetical protein
MSGTIDAKALDELEAELRARLVKHLKGGG